MSKALVSTRPTFASPRSYEELLQRVRETLEAGRVRARQALQEIQSRMFWETGRWINLYLKHEKKTPDRAPYGEKVIGKLAEDLKYDKDYLYDALSVYRNNTIFGTFRKLTISHHRALLQVKDTDERKTLESEAEKKGWTSRELARRIRELAPLADGKPPHKSGPSPLRARKGKLHHYRIVERNGRLFLDLGFRDFRELREHTAKSDFKDGDIVEGASIDQLAKRPEATKADLYTYKADVLDFPDADTYWLFIDKGFGGYRLDKIRLRGIDAPEISTPEGQKAKAFVKKLLPPSTEVLITTTKSPDKWDRYLVDFYFEKDGREIYLNRLLLDKGWAVPYEE